MVASSSLTLPRCITICPMRLTEAAPSRTKAHSLEIRAATVAMLTMATALPRQGSTRQGMTTTPTWLLTAKEIEWTLRYVEKQSRLNSFKDSLNHSYLCIK